MLHATRVFDGERFVEDCRIDVADGVITAVTPGQSPLPGDERITEGFLAPGLLDLQINGFAGVDFASASPADFTTALSALAATGTTSCLPTVITAPVEDILGALDRIAAARGGPGARVIGAHVEGPFLSERRKGAHRAELMLDPSADDIERLAAHPALSLLTLAPERDGGMLAVELLARAGVVPSIGHSDATAEQVHAAAAHGARMVTHVFNAQRPIGHREPGVPGAALVDDRLFLGLIADLHHVAPDMVRLAFAAAPDRIVLVTDALASAGMPPGVYELGGESIVVTDAEQPARRLDGTMSGSGLTMAAAIRNCCSIGVPLAQGLRAATSLPAAALRRTDVGVITTGAHADLVWFDEELTVGAVWMDGRRITASA